MNCFGTVLKDLSKKMVSLAIINQIFSTAENIINLSEPLFPLSYIITYKKWFIAYHNVVCNDGEFLLQINYVV